MTECFLEGAMILPVLVTSLFFVAIDGHDILEKAHDAGFFYRAVSFVRVDECKGQELCFESGGNRFVIKRNDSLEITAQIKEGKLEINIVPDSTYISYFLYIEHKAGVHKIQMTNRNVVIDKGVANIMRLQIIGTGPNGPVTVFSKTLRKNETPSKFSGSFDESLKKLRQRYSLSLLKNDSELAEPAGKVLERVNKSGLVHYSAESGGPGHTGIRKKVIGENLFYAKTVEKAWEMMVNSPSHLYNLINPSYKSYYFAVTEENDFISGVVLFSD